LTDLNEIRQEVEEFNRLLDPVANAEVDINDPNWQKKLDEDQHPLDEVGIREAAERLTQTIMELFLGSNSKGRSQIRKLLADNQSFSWAMTPPESSDPERVFRDRVLLFVMDDTVDTRDAIMGIGTLVDDARSSGVRYRPILKQIAKVAGTTDRYGFGSLRSVIKRHC